MRLRRTALPLLVTGLLTLTACGDDEGPAAAEDPAPTDGVSCDYQTDGSEPAKDVEPPSSTATETGSVPVTMATSVGDLALTLDADAAPCTVHSFLSLAEQGFYDDTSCHRLTTEAAGIFVLQCGDPTGSGSGGPGYRFEDELTGQETYPAGTLAMANAGPDTNGSQFFIVYQDTPLGADYTVFGSIDEDSIATVAEVAEAGSDDAFGPGSGHPVTPVDIESVTAE